MKINTSKPESISFTKVLDSFYVYTGDVADRYVQRSCIDTGVWDKELTEWMMQNIKPGWNCLDIGANIFYFTEIMSRMSGPSGKVLAFEPIKRLCDMYSVARTLNDYSGCSDIKVFPFALSSKEDKLILNIWEENIGGAGIVHGQRVGNDGQHGKFYTEEIDSKPLNDVYSDRIDFMKIDVEGHERFVFEGFSDSAKNCNLIVIELGSGQPDSFLVELNEKYVMTFLNEEEATFEKIKQHDVVNVLLKRKI